MCHLEARFFKCEDVLACRKLHQPVETEFIGKCRMARVGFGIPRGYRDGDNRGLARVSDRAGDRCVLGEGILGRAEY